MNKTATYSIWAILMVTTIFSLYFAFNNPKDIGSSETEKNLFMDQVSQCSSDLSTSDRFLCLSNLVETTAKEANVLADKLITQAPIRLKEVTSNNASASFMYGGKDFLTDLPIQVGKAQKTRDEYMNSICNLASMKIYGGSGMDLEQNACKYHFMQEYLQILKALEKGLNTS